MDYLLEEFDLNIMKANHMLEMSLDKYNILMNECVNLYRYDYIDEEGVSETYHKESASIGEAVGNFFSNIYETIKKFCNGIIEKIRIKIQSIQLKSRLKNAKLILARSKSEANRQVTIYDTLKYVNTYNKWIDWEVKGVNKILNGKYNTQAELTDAITIFEEDSKAYMNKIKLDDKDAYKLNVSISKAITYTENQLDNIQKLNNLPGIWEDSLKKIENMFKGKPDSTKIGWIKRKANFLNTQGKKVAAGIATLFTATIAAIFAVIKILDSRIDGNDCLV